MLKCEIPLELVPNEVQLLGNGKIPLHRDLPLPSSPFIKCTIASFDARIA